MKKSTLIIAAAAFIGLVCIAWILTSLSQPKTKYTSSTPKENEAAIDKSVGFTNTTSLNDIMLPSQVRTTLSALDAFVFDYLDPNTTSGGIISSPTVNQDGSVTFVAEVKAPAGKRYSFERKDPNSDFATGQTVTGTSQATTRFTVLINRDSYTTITITIKEYNYTVVEPLSN